MIDAGESLINFVDSIWLISGTAELSEITSTEEAADWAHRVLGAKNGLIAADGERIDEAFRGKLATFATATANGLETPPEKERPRTQRPSHRGKSVRIDPSITARALWLETHPLPANTHRWPEKGPLPHR